MAYEILYFGGNIEHQPHHDLESLFYVFIWICITYEGPKQKHRKIRDFTDECSPLYQWFSGKSFMTTAETKKGQMDPIMWKTGKARLLQEFTAYFEDFKTCAIELNHAFFGQEEHRVTHEELITIFQSALDRTSARHKQNEFREFSAKFQVGRAVQTPSPLVPTSSKRRMESDLTYSAVTQTMPSMAFHSGDSESSGTDNTVPSILGGSSSMAGLYVVTSPGPRLSDVGSFKKRRHVNDVVSDSIPEDILE